MSGLCGARYRHNMGAVCGKLAGHLPTDPFHHFIPGNPDTYQWLDHDSYAPTPTTEMADVVVQECAACSSPAQPEHSPCCASPMHGKALCCAHYCKYHYVEVNRCSPSTHREDR